MLEDNSGAGGCPQGPMSVPLRLFDAVERALCTSPRTQAAWAEVKAAAARVGESKAAYLPTLQGSAEYIREHVSTEVTHDPALKSSYGQGVNEESLSLSWVLYDFGYRSASLNGNRALLAAAQASQNGTLQSVFAAVAKDYFDAQSADAKVRSTQRIEEAAKQILDAAVARVSRGVAPVTDQLQANTAYAEAVYQRAKAVADSRAALGALALDMDMPPDQGLSLQVSNQEVVPDTGFVQSVHDLVDDAIRTHPSVVAAEAQWRAATEKVRSVRALGWPTLSIVGQLSYSGQPVSASLGQPELPAVTHDNYIGMKLSVPLFEGFNRHYLIHEAEAEEQEQEQILRDAKRRVAGGVWTSFQSLEADGENLRNADTLLRSAQESFEAVRHRYQSGVGSILELLSSQNALASAEQRRIQAQSDWRTARIQLALSLGKLGMWAVE